MILSEMNIPVKTVNALGKKKINTVNDLVMYFPRKYSFYEHIVDLKLTDEGKSKLDFIVNMGFNLELEFSPY